MRQEGIFISCAPSCLESGCLGTFLDIPTQSTPLWSWLVSFIFISLLLDIGSGRGGGGGTRPTSEARPASHSLPRTLPTASLHPPHTLPHPAHTLPCLTQALRE